VRVADVRNLREFVTQWVNVTMPLDGYLSGQRVWLVNYGERHRVALRVGTAITEGTANFLVNRRMNKSQQMRVLVQFKL
jgi:hypothetical protein